MPIVPVKYSGKMKEMSDLLYQKMQDAGVEVLLDDRDERVGVKFKDWDLIGIPFRLVVSEKNLPNIEIKYRNSGKVGIFTQEDVIKEITQLIHCVN